MFPLSCAIFCFVLFAGQTSGLVELPQVDDNNILTTEIAIRGTVNTLFDKLGLRGVKTKTRIKEYSAVHKSLIAFTLQDYTTLKEIARLTRVDKTKINNETRSFMAVLNELLNEDIEVGTEPSITEGTVSDDNVEKYIDQFLTTLETLKEQFGVTNEKFHIKDDVYQIIKDNAVLSYNFTVDHTYDSDLEENDTLIQESYFWNDSGRRIFQGDRKKIKYFPFMASIQIFNRFHCGGSIIKSDLVITASSCLQLAWNNRFFRENPAFLSARVGSTFYNGGGENIPVFEVYFHPEYNPKNLRNNICLLRLSRKLKFRRRTKRLRKIDFDRQESNLPYTTDGITIVGWGARGSSNIVQNPWENSLSYAILDIYPLRECQDIYSREYVTNKHFCAGFFSKGGGACNRDVGGPGIVNGILTGVVSFGSPVCGAPDAPTVFTKVGYYTDWIETIMEQNVPSAYQRTTLKPRFEVTLGQNYRPIKSTTFKITPMSGKMKPIPVTDVDALRMLKEGNLFEEFLHTMFSEKDAAKYKNILGDTYQLRQAQVKEDIEEPTLRKPFESKEVEDTTFDEPAMTDIQMMTEDPSYFITDMVAYEPERIPVPASDENQAVSRVDSYVQIDQNKELERDLVNLIDDLDLKQLVADGPSVELDKLIDQNNIMDIFKAKDGNDKISELIDQNKINVLKTKEVNDKITEIDDSVLTLLYLSDSERNDKKEDMDYEDDDDVQGLSIPSMNAEDLTLRKK